MFTFKGTKEMCVSRPVINNKKRVILEILNAAIDSHALFLKITTWFLAECIVHSTTNGFRVSSLLMCSSMLSENLLTSYKIPGDAVGMHQYCCHVQSILYVQEVVTLQKKY